MPIYDSKMKAVSTEFFFFAFFRNRWLSVIIVDA